MILGVQGTRKFDDYNIFLRSMHTALSDMDMSDKTITIYSAGTANINSMVTEFVNISERSLKARGIRIKFLKLPPQVIAKKVDEINYLIFLCKPGERTSDLVEIADNNNVDVGIYRF